MLIFCLIMFVLAVDLNTKFCLDLFSAPVTGRKNIHWDNSFYFLTDRKCVINKAKFYLVLL